MPDTDDTPALTKAEARAEARRAADTPALEPEPTPDEIAAAKAEAEQAASAAQAEADKAHRAEHVLTGAATGETAEQAYTDRIAEAKFALRNQGHTHIEALLDEMHAALKRIEGKAAGG
jgi:hypothetical protein